MKYCNNRGLVPENLESFTLTHVIGQYLGEGEVTATALNPATVNMITPSPGLVLQSTCVWGDETVTKEKIFVNLWYHNDLIREGQDGHGKSEDLSKYYFLCTEETRVTKPPTCSVYHASSVEPPPLGSKKTFIDDRTNSMNLCTLVDVVVHPQILIQLCLRSTDNSVKKVSIAVVIDAAHFVVSYY